jgi:hypothetical protein
LLSYEVDGSILIVRASGTTTNDEREAVSDAVRADERVRNGAPLLLDAREVDGIGDRQAVVERLRSLLQHLGPKLGQVCALLVTPKVRDQADTFKTEAVRIGLRVELFADEAAARPVAQCVLTTRLERRPIRAWRRFL